MNNPFTLFESYHDKAAIAELIAVVLDLFTIAKKPQGFFATLWPLIWMNN